MVKKMKNQQFTLCDIAAIPPLRNSKYSSIKKALLAAEDGKAIKLPVDTFLTIAVSSHLRMDRETQRKLHVRRRADGVYIWLDPQGKAKGKK
jgi:hypothetical protein